MTTEKLLKEAFEAGYKAGRQLMETRGPHYGGCYRYGSSSYSGRKALDTWANKVNSRVDEFEEECSEKVKKLLQRMFTENPLPEKLTKVNSFKWDCNGQTESVYIRINHKYPECGYGGFYMWMDEFEEIDDENELWKSLLRSVKVADRDGEIVAAPEKAVDNQIQPE